MPRPNLSEADFSCTIHTELRERGFPGCTVYDCFGAGQRVVQEHAAGGGAQDRRSSPEVREEMFATFEVVERLHELLWYLEEAASRTAARRHREEVEGLRQAVEAAAAAPQTADVVSLQLRADPLLGEVSALVRAGAGGAGLRQRDLAGRDLRGEDLAAADLRGADVRGADLGGALFLTQFQINAATGDARTMLPTWLERPGHWR